MQVLAFDLVGKLAHFRKYYANNTAMSFSVPPRTTLMGVLAAMLGLPRDSYYAALAGSQLRLGVGVRSPLKKSFHRLNFLKVERPSHLNGSHPDHHIQVPFEVVSGHDLTRDLVRYRVYVAPTAAGQAIFDQLVAQLTTGGGPHFALSLGTANFSAALENVRLHPQAQTRSSDEVLEFHSTVPTELILPQSLATGTAISLEEELLPADFVGAGQRELAAMNRVLFSTDGQPLRAQVRGEFFELSEANETQRLLFLE